MEKKKNRNAVNLGRLGGLARAKKLSKEERVRIAKLGAEAAAASGNVGGRPKKKKKP